MGGFGMPEGLGNRGGDWEAGYRACLQVLASSTSWMFHTCVCECQLELCA